MTLAFPKAVKADEEKNDIDPYASGFDPFKLKFHYHCVVADNIEFSSILSQELNHKHNHTIGEFKFNIFSVRVDRMPGGLEKIKWAIGY